MQRPFAMHLSPRCGAKTRSGKPCRAPAMPNGKCYRRAMLPEQPFEAWKENLNHHQEPRGFADRWVRSRSK